MRLNLIKAISPADLLEQVNDAIKAGNDMTSPLFVSHEGLLCQWMGPLYCMYEYKLIVALELDDLDTQANNLRALSFDFFMNTCLWEGFYLQWMCRMNDGGKSVRDALKAISAERSEELHLVEGVRAVLHMAPTADKLG
jgi:hypothetical protein